MVDVAGERNGVQGLTLLRERLLLDRGEHLGGEHALIGRLRRVIALDDLAADAPLAEELANGAEEVVLQAEQAVQALQDGEGGAGAIAVVADEAADEQAIALFDPGLIVLAIRATPGEADFMAAAPAEQAAVDKLTAVVAMPLAQGKRHPLGDGVDAAGDALLVQVPDRLQFRPGRGDVDGDERGAVPARGGFPAMQTRSPCIAPAVTPAHSLQVRSGTWARTTCRAVPARRGWPGRRRRRGRSSRSSVAGLAASRAARAGAVTASP